MRSGAVRIATLFGIDVRVHRSWLIIVLLVGWSFVSRYVADDRSVGVAIVMAVAATVIFFGSVLVHELSHSLEARRRGVQVGGITLFIFGGATETRFDVRRPVDEFALTAVGPLSSFVLAGLLGLVAIITGDVEGLGPVALVTGQLAWINLALGVFNLLPGAPLDGGRILRSAVWKITGDRARGIRVASRAGQVLGWTIAGLGVLQLFLAPQAFLGGLWFLFIGWFLANAASSELVHHELEDRLSGVVLGELVSDAPLPTVAADTDLATAAEQLRRGPEDFLAVTRDGDTVGLLGLDDVAAVPRDERPEQRVDEVARPYEELERLDADAELVAELQTLTAEPLVAVVRDGTVLGVVSREQIRRVLSRSLMLDGPTRGARRQPEDHIPHREERLRSTR